MNDQRATQKFRRGMIVASVAEMVYQLTGCNMSSPQTAQMNAPARAGTIDFWVRLTNVEAAAWTLFFTWLYGSPWAIVGGAVAGTGMWGKYRYAITTGLKQGGPPTENYQNPNAPYGHGKPARAAGFRTR